MTAGPFAVVGLEGADFEAYGLQPVHKVRNITGALAPEGRFRPTEPRYLNVSAYF